MMQVVLIGIGAGAATALAVRVGRVRLGAFGAAVLSRAAADPDRGDGLEPLGGADRGGRRVGRPRRGVRLVLLHRLPDRHRPAGVVARLSRAAGAAGARPRPTGSNGIRSAIWCSGPRSSARAIVIAAMLTSRHRSRTSFRAVAAQRPRAHAAACQTRHAVEPGRCSAGVRAEPADRYSWSRCCRRPRPCSPPSPTSSISGSPSAS